MENDGSARVSPGLDRCCCIWSCDLLNCVTDEILGEERWKEKIRSLWYNKVKWLGEFEGGRLKGRFVMRVWEICDRIQKIASRRLQRSNSRGEKSHLTEVYHLWIWSRCKLPATFLYFRAEPLVLLPYGACLQRWQVCYCPILSFHLNHAIWDRSMKIHKSPNHFRSLYVWSELREKREWLKDEWYKPRPVHMDASRVSESFPIIGWFQSWGWTDTSFLNAYEQ